MKVNWNEEYERVLHEICEKPRGEDEPIVEIMDYDLMAKMIPNENAPWGARWMEKLPDDATEEDKKAFCYFIYARSGEDFDEYLKEQEKVFY